MQQPTSTRRFLTTEVQEDIAEQFRQLCRAEDRSVSAGLRRLVKQYVARTSEGAGQGASANETVEADRVAAAS